jgi:hypothetical protein
MKTMIQRILLGAMLLTGKTAWADIRMTPGGSGLDDFAGICTAELDRCLNDVEAILFVASITGNLEEATEDHIDGCFAVFKTCMKHASKGLPFDLNSELDPEPGHNIEPVKTPVAVPVPIDCGPQLVPGDNRTWAEWATDQCTDIWNNRLGLPLPPALRLPQPDVSGFMNGCMQGLLSCPQKPVIHDFCGDGCQGHNCPGASRGISFCPTPLPGMPVVPAPVRVPVPILPFPGLLVP